MMDWHDLAYFVSLVEQRTLTASAEWLGVQHSTVSRRIERLEQTLGLKLFDRLGKRYSLTQEGELLYAQATEVQKEIVIFQRMAIDQNAMQGNVVISAPPVLANEILMAALPAFRQQYPDIVLQLRGDVHISDLHRKEADIALRLSRPTQDDLIIRTLSHVRYGFFVHKDYLERTPTEQWQLIEFQANKRVLNWSQHLLQQHPYPIAFSSNDFYVVYSAVCQGLGFAILPSFLANKNPELQPINPINKTVISAHDIDNVTVSKLSEQKVYQQTDNIISSISQPIALIQSQPLYMVMHPYVRRSVRVRVVADWLGSVFENSLKT